MGFAGNQNNIKYGAMRREPSLVNLVGCCTNVAVQGLNMSLFSIQAAAHQDKDTMKTKLCFFLESEYALNSG